jgi:GT2 family glycosyltransferase
MGADSSVQSRYLELDAEKLSSHSMNNRMVIFLLLVVLRPLKAAAIGYWYVTRRRKRALGHLKAATSGLPLAYARWLGQNREEELAWIESIDPRKIAGFPGFSIHVHLSTLSDRREFSRAIRSVMRQDWPYWNLIVTAAGWVPKSLIADSRITVIEGIHTSYQKGLRAAFRAATTEYLVPLQAHCTLPRDALVGYIRAAVQNGHRSPPILYGDQDERSRVGSRRNPWLKPDWDPEMFLAQDYISAACAIPIVAARQIFDTFNLISDTAAVYGLLLQMSGEPKCTFRHVTRVTVSTPRGHWRANANERLGLLRQFLEKRAVATILAGPFGTASIRWPLPVDAPLVSIIVPTRDRLDLLQPCVEGVLERTRYPEIELIIADNQSAEPETLEFLSHIVAADPRARVISWPYPYNYSAINNFAAAGARGAYLCLLNNDIEIIDEDWLSELMRYAVRPGAGAAGARLLYPDHSVQHAGVVVGLGNAAGHAHRGLGLGQCGYFANAYVAHRASAVTAACLVVRKDLFEQVSGLDENDLQIAYNDVDFCLKLRAAGATNYYVPSSILIHHESKSRGSDMSTEHLDRYLRELGVFQMRWKQAMDDPMHHPFLDRSSEVYRPTYL